MEITGNFQRKKYLVVLIILKIGDGSILFIVIKNRERRVATYKHMYLALVNLKHVCEERYINILVINKLGQRDNLEWEKVGVIISYIFNNTYINILYLCRNRVYRR